MEQHGCAQAGCVGRVTHLNLSNNRICFCCFLCYCAALYQKVVDLAQGIGQQGQGQQGRGNNGSGGYGRGGGGNSSDDGIAQKGEGLLAMLAELDITKQSYSQHLQALLMDVSGVPVAACSIVGAAKHGGPA